MITAPAPPPTLPPLTAFSLPVVRKSTEGHLKLLNTMYHFKSWSVGKCYKGKVKDLNCDFKLTTATSKTCEGTMQFVMSKQHQRMVRVSKLVCSKPKP